MIVNTEEAAKLLNVSPRRVRQFVDDGRLHAHSWIKGAHLFWRDDVEELSKIPRKAGKPKKQ